MGSSSFYLPDIATRARGHYIIQFVPSLIIHTVSGQVAENLALFEAHIKGAFAVDADIAYIVIQPLLRDIVVLVNFPLRP